MEPANYELIPGWHLLKIPSADTGMRLQGQSDSFADHQDDVVLNTAILCRYCLNQVTSSEHRTVINGSHGHRRYNPVGVIFDVGCFSLAPGCNRQGVATLEHTWFPGYAWSYALCSNCQTHLGWFFESGTGHVFVGLILDKLIEPA